MAVQTTPADAAFSKCVRERVDWTCERCGRYFPEGPARRGLHNSHLFGRRNGATRFCADACFSLCYGCHSHLDANKSSIYRAFAIEKLGEGMYDILVEKSNSQYKWKRDMRAIAKHYRQELEKMRQKRMNGETGRLEFEGWY